MEKIINRKRIGFKSIIILISVVFLITYLIFQQIYIFRKNKLITVIEHLVKQNDYKEANLKIEKYSNDFEINEEIIYLKIKILQNQRETISSNYREEIIQLIFFLKSIFSFENIDINFFLGKTYYDLEESYYKQADFYLRQYLSKVEVNQEIEKKLYPMLYRTSLHLNKVKESLFYVKKLTKNDPENILLQMDLVIAFLKNKKNIEAKKILEDIIITREYNALTLTSIKLLMDILFKLEIREKIDFYNDYVLNKFQLKKEFIEEYKKYYKNKISLKDKLK